MSESATAKAGDIIELDFGFWKRRYILTKDAPFKFSDLRSVKE